MTSPSMKRCRYCAEEIQASAVICRYCGRILRREVSSDGSVIRTVLVGVVCFVLGAGAYAGGAKLMVQQAKAAASAAGTPGVQMLVPPEEPPIVVPPPPAVALITDYSDLQVAAGGVSSYTFEVTDPRPCVLTGHVTVIGGGNRAVNVHVVDDDGLTNVRNRTEEYSYFKARRTSSVQIAATLPRPGRYHLAISNNFSTISPKSVRIENARVTCG